MAKYNSLLPRGAPGTNAVHIHHVVGCEIKNQSGTSPFLPSHTFTSTVFLVLEKFKYFSLWLGINNSNENQRFF